MSSILSQKIKVALIQFKSSNVNKLINLQNVEKFIDKAMIQQPDTKINCPPRMFNSPYSIYKFKDYAEPISSTDLTTPTLSILSKISLKYKIILVGGSIPELDPTTSKLYNTSIIFNEMGQLIGKHRKAHLFDIDIPNGITFKESTTLSPGSKATTLKTTYGNIGIGICYDLRFPELAMISARKNAFVMIYPGAFNTVTGPMHWHLLAKSRSIDNQIYTILCSPARNLESDYHAYGHSLVVNPKGEIIAEAGEGEEIVFATLDPMEIENFRKAIPITTQRRFDIYDDVSANIE
ncbi:putative hydrolase NDAI_0D01350 [Naumovozyma dairenensis CBS 421]|uniref:CN hydrolase domain-containing protein n=1 Tax=Naumovozyma dairenensis (strain ATCC 10597 / BCRC 20456 / CBS 421 / NBRC 0211 / NRRL Y-12639) TaxID=1071378 RepID=G0W9I8_NAUDC|nr:hypothetical protein NDAI_0D01350 [Naumovozyma dairenensis CBS 421]CCD24449.1 hypothetical protein NDAI_0D01350 [Naumovozyma dairenensis CBS 421]